MKYAEVLVDWLVELGYSHCFFVAGGNNMHLLDGVRSRMTCVPFVHEVAAGIAAEYFNETGDGDKAFALVTAGPGLTNIVTALGGAYLESRELLVVGGQVKSTDLASGGLRQRGIQEIDGIALAAPVCVATLQITEPVDRSTFAGVVQQGWTGRPGPVFIEICLDAQGAPVDRADLEDCGADQARAVDAGTDEAGLAEGVAAIAERWRAASRPVLLLGGGVSRAAAARAAGWWRDGAVPVMTTWNGADRVDSAEPYYLGRPNTWGQRSSNVVLQQADLIVALGTRLGLQQTGFNWQEFAPAGDVVQVDIDPAELHKGHPDIALGLALDADDVLDGLGAAGLAGPAPWMAFAQKVRALLPLADDGNETAPGYVDPFRFVLGLSERCHPTDVVIPCSSGGAFTVMMQAFEQQQGQIMVTDKGLASMGYGLSGAIGAALANPGRRTVLVEGDGGFAQNLQELGTVAVNALPLKIFLFANEGYASIRMTQRNYFGGAYLGCDTSTGLGFPRWPALFEAFGIPVVELDAGDPFGGAFAQRFAQPGPAAFVVPIDPEQTYFPKITSRVTATGSMESEPLHRMAPDLSETTMREIFKWL